MDLQRQLGLPTATLTVVASMMGTGIFFTTGIILSMTHNALTVLILWILGGITALSGALCYVELATLWPQTGGEYVYLKNIYGRLPAFLTGWISLVVGFSAPVATGALALVSYLNAFHRDMQAIPEQATDLIPDLWAQKGLAAAIVILLSLMHMAGVRLGSSIQNVLTVVKLLIAASFVIGGLYLADWSQAGRLTADYPWSQTSADGGLPTLGLSLLIIMFSYSGWNAASYIAGEIKEPERNLPKALVLGTVVTGLLYFLLNIVYLIAVPGQNLMGQEAVGAITARNLFSLPVVQFYTLGIVLILLSSISVQMMIGPRVYYAMAKDHLMFSPLARINPRLGTPVASIALQMVLAVAYVLTGSAQKLLEYMGFALVVFPLLAVFGLIKLRRGKSGLDRPYRFRFYPWAPLIYMVMTVAMAVAGLMTWTRTTWFALGVVLAGIPVFYIWEKYSNRRSISE